MSRRPSPNWKAILDDLRTVRVAIDRAIPAIEFIAEWEKAKEERRLASNPPTDPADSSVHACSGKTLYKVIAEVGDV